MASAGYDLDPAYEKSLVGLLCTNPKFFGAIGKYIEPELLSIPASGTLVRAAQQIAHDVGSSPTNHELVRQRVKNWQVQDNTLTEREYKEASALLDEALSTAPGDPEHFKAGIIPILKHRVETRATKLAVKTAQAKGDFQAAVRLYEEATKIGKSNANFGYSLDADNWDDVDAMKAGERLPMQFAALSNLLSGGLARGHFGLIVAKSGGGKSTFLADQARMGWQSGYSAAVATLELPVGQVLAKIRAGATGFTLNQVIENKTCRPEISDRLREVAKTAGKYLIVQDFEPMSTLWSDIVEWLNDLKERHGSLPDVVCIDFLAKLGYSRKDDSGNYVRQARLADAMYTYAKVHNIFIWSGSQAQRDCPAIIGLDNLNESQGKAEAASLVLTANKRENNQIYWWNAKDRMGIADEGCGPYPHDFSHGRVCTPEHRELIEEVEDYGI